MNKFLDSKYGTGIGIGLVIKLIKLEHYAKDWYKLDQRDSS